MSASPRQLSARTSASSIAPGGPRRPTVELVAGVLTLVCGACGLRTDPAGELICVEPGDEDGTETGTDTGSEPESGSCEAPTELPWATFEVHGNLGGCSDASGWCGGSGGEDYYKIVAPADALDVVVEFDPQGTDIDPVLRVVRIPLGDDARPCELDEVDTVESEWQGEMICAPLVTDDARYAFFAQPGYDYYLIVDSHARSAGAYEFSFEYGVAAVGELCLQNVPEELVPPTLSSGQSIELSGSLDARQGHFDHADVACTAIGHEHVIPISITAPGTFTARVTSWSGAEPPVLGLTQGCSPHFELDCGTVDLDGALPEVSAVFNTAIDTYLIVDQAAAEGGDYTVELALN